MKTKVATFILRAILSAVFLYAGLIKAWNPEQFWVDVQNYQMLPHWANVATALYLPYVEIFCGVAIWLRRWSFGALGLMGGMMGIFTVALLSAWWRGLDITCGCFGGGEKNRYVEWLVRDVLLLGVIAWVAWRDWFLRIRQEEKNW